MSRGNPSILLVDADPSLAGMVRRNLEEGAMSNRLTHLTDGQSALDYLYRQGDFCDPASSPRPGLILLGLRLPRVDGLVLLNIIKSDPDLLPIPTVVLSNSAASEDKESVYDSHANSYLVKPVDLAGMAAMIEAVGNYWLNWNKWSE
jgi:CheY-like chemotaxis protein